MCAKHKDKFFSQNQLLLIAFLDLRKTIVILIITYLQKPTKTRKLIKH